MELYTSMMYLSFAEMRSVGKVCSKRKIFPPIAPPPPHLHPLLHMDGAALSLCLTSTSTKTATLCVLSGGATSGSSPSIAISCTENRVVHTNCPGVFISQALLRLISKTACRGGLQRCGVDRTVLPKRV